jgi:hypothetical protein
MPRRIEDSDLDEDEKVQDGKPEMDEGGGETDDLPLTQLEGPRQGPDAAGGEDPETNSNLDAAGCYKCMVALCINMIAE